MPKGLFHNRSTKNDGKPLDPELFKDQIKSLQPAISNYVLGLFKRNEQLERDKQNLTTENRFLRKFIKDSLGELHEAKNFLRDTKQENLNALIDKYKKKPLMLMMFAGPLT